MGVVPVNIKELTKNRKKIDDKNNICDKSRTFSQIFKTSSFKRSYCDYFNADKLKRKLWKCNA